MQVWLKYHKHEVTRSQCQITWHHRQNYVKSTRQYFYGVIINFRIKLWNNSSYKKMYSVQLFTHPGYSQIKAVNWRAVAEYWVEFCFCFICKFKKMCVIQWSMHTHGYYKDYNPFVLVFHLVNYPIFFCYVCYKAFFRIYLANHGKVIQFDTCVPIRVIILYLVLLFSLWL